MRWRRCVCSLIKAHSTSTATVSLLDVTVLNSWPSRCRQWSQTIHQRRACNKTNWAKLPPLSTARLIALVLLLPCVVYWEIESVKLGIRWALNYTHRHKQSVIRYRFDRWNLKTFTHNEIIDLVRRNWFHLIKILMLLLSIITNKKIRNDRFLRIFWLLFPIDKISIEG